MGEKKIPHKLTNRDLYEKQMKMLKEFLDSGAISKLQYDTSVQGLKEKMKC
jgi:hypothetical protein